jgi:hypothetical protein
MAYNGYPFRGTTDDGSSSPRRHLSEVSDSTLVNVQSCERAFPDLSDGRNVPLTPAQTHLLANARSSSATSRSLKQVKEELVEKAKDVSDDVYQPPIPTTRCLQQFAQVVARKVDPVVQERKDTRLRAADAERRIHDQTLLALRQWVESKDSEASWGGVLNRFFTFWRTPQLPDSDQLIDLTLHHYPLRGDLTVYVCDFGEDRFEKHEVAFSDLDQCKLSSL